MKKDNNKTKIAYRVKQWHDFTEPYSYGEDVKNIINHKTYDEYLAYDEKTFHDILDEFLDAPKKKLTDEDVMKDFDNIDHKLSKSKIKMIKAYYNDRYELSKKIFAKLKTIDLGKIEVEYPIVMRFSIPFHMNYFTCVDDDPYDGAVVMNGAGIEIEILRAANEK